MAKKIKTFASELVKQHCTDPARREVNKAIEQNRTGDAYIGSNNVTFCRLWEESVKAEKPKKKRLFNNL